MGEAEESERRDVETEEPLEGQRFVKGPAWLRRLFVGGRENGR